MGYSILSTDNKTWVYLETDYSPMYVFVIPLVNMLGLILTLACFIVFNDSKFKQNVYTFLKYESVFIAIDLLISALRPIYNYNSEFSTSYFPQFYYIYMLVGAASVLEMSAILCHIVSTFYLYLLITNKPLSRNIPSLAVCFMIFMFSLVLFSYHFFDSVIVSNQVSIRVSQNQTINRAVYGNVETEFGKTDWKKIIDIFVFCLRDGFCLLVLMVLNIMIFTNVKLLMKRKQTILGSSVKYEKRSMRQSKRNTQYKTTERKTSIMVVIIGLSYIIGRLPILVINILKNFIKFDYLSQANTVSVLLVYISYSSYFFIYYTFNKLFRNVFWRFFFNK